VNERIKLYYLDKKPEYFDLKISGELCQGFLVRDNEKYEGDDGITVLIEKYENAIEIYGVIPKAIAESFCELDLCNCTWNKEVSELASLCHYTDLAF